MMLSSKMKKNTQEDMCTKGKGRSCGKLGDMITMRCISGSGERFGC